MTAKTYILVAVSVIVSMKVGGQQRLGLRAEKLRPGRVRPVRGGVDPGPAQDRPDR
jgi:hypothetical protein